MKKLSRSRSPVIGVFHFSWLGAATPSTSLCVASLWDRIGSRALRTTAFSVVGQYAQIGPYLILKDRNFHVAFIFLLLLGWPWSAVARWRRRSTSWSPAWRSRPRSPKPPARRALHLPALPRLRRPPPQPQRRPQPRYLPIPQLHHRQPEHQPRFQPIRRPLHQPIHQHRHRHQPIRLRPPTRLHQVGSTNFPSFMISLPKLTSCRSWWPYRLTKVALSRV